MAKAILLAVVVLVLAAPATAGAPSRSANERVIRAVFGPRYDDQAVAVASCESGLSVWAKNGQYLGLFQMGSYARSRYGHGWNAWAQARAANHYFRDSGRDWSPWSCKPW
jgi:hypothetical protein